MYVLSLYGDPDPPGYELFVPDSNAIDRNSHPDSAMGFIQNMFVKKHKILGLQDIPVPVHFRKV